MAEVTYDLKVPEGAPFTADALPGFIEEAKALALAPDVAQKLVDYRAKTAPRVPEKYELKSPNGANLTAEHLAVIATEAKELGLTNAAAQKLVEHRAKNVVRPPDKYELALPDGSPLSKDDLEVVSQHAKLLGLTNKQAQDLLGAQSTFASDLSKKLDADLRADSELGGAKYDATIAAAVKGRDFLFPQGSADAKVVIDWFNRTGLGNHKALVRAFARLGQLVAEDSGAPGGAGGLGRGAQKRGLDERMYAKDGGKLQR